MVVWPRDGLDHEVSDFLHWLTVTHAQRWHAHYHSSGFGHLYQGRYKSFQVESDEHLYPVRHRPKTGQFRVLELDTWQRFARFLLITRGGGLAE